MAQQKKITVIGGGLAGSEAAFQLAELISEHNLPYEIDLYEMRPVRKTPAHHTDKLAELVCSNSLGSEFLTTARGLLIKEMQHFDSLIIDAAIKSKVPAGQALAVDRDKFGELVTSTIENHPKINLIREELTEIPKDGYVLIATGPLTSEALAEEIKKLLCDTKEKLRANSSQTNNELDENSVEFLNFFDAASPILTVDSVDMDIAYRASRYGKGNGDDYINCPFYDEEEFTAFYNELINAERAEQKDFEKGKYFEACLPIEVIASRGKETMKFGPLKPVGLIDPRYIEPEERINPKTGETEIRDKWLKKPVAVVQLRQDNVVGSLYNMVGFQTNLKWGEQKRIFSMIPGLKDIDIVRYGVMHQNIYINSPDFLNANMELRANPKISFAGQMTGVEGYTESAATGIIAARDIVIKIFKEEGKSIKELGFPEIMSETGFVLPKETMLGALTNYIASADPKNFQPMNSNWGIVNTNPDDMDKQTRKSKKLKNEFLANRAISLIEGLKKEASLV